ncbi:MAG: hypothetical protein KIT54_03840 [Phycisphaeraceae bacterium]|nr:hypothetical protein [Phycisphaeraceae bacterium]
MSWGSNWRILLAAAVCLGGIFAAYFAWSGARPREVVRTSASAADAVAPAKNLVTVKQVGVDEMVDRTLSAVAADLILAGLPKQDVLAGDVEAILRAWWSGTGEDYLAYLSKAGVPPPSERWSDIETANAMWAESTAAIRAASFDPDGATFRTTFRDGQQMPSDERYARTWGSRFDKITGISSAAVEAEDLLRAGLTMHEVRIPMRMATIRADLEFDALLGLSYGWDARRSTWALVAVTIYGVPNGHAVRRPAF